MQLKIIIHCIDILANQLRNYVVVVIYNSLSVDHRARVQYYNALAKFVQTRAQIVDARQRQINNDSERTQHGVIQLIYKRKLQENFSSKRNPSIQRDTVKKKRKVNNYTR